MQGLTLKGILKNMPRKNARKTYLENGIYHIYNRGVEKRVIFLDDQDYKVFLRFLKELLTKPPDKKAILKDFTLKGSTFKGILRQPLNLHKQLELLAYCLMPNHFHLLIKQTNEKVMKHFMQSLCIRYSMYFNKKYKRIGSLFQGVYKAVLVMEESYLLHLSRYIHLNPLKHSQNLLNTYSSYADYLGKRTTIWMNINIILSYFGSVLTDKKDINSYQDFVEKYTEDSAKTLGKLTLDEETY